MYFFSSKYIQINNNTKTKIKVPTDKVPLTLRLLPCFHLDAKSFSLDFSELELTSSSFENLGR